MHAIVRTVDNVILSIGSSPEASIDATIVTLSDSQLQTINNAPLPNGGFVLNADGTVAVLPSPAPPPPDPSVTDYQTNFNAMITRLNDIIANGPTYTAAQSRDAVVDEARMLRRLFVYLSRRIW